MFKKYYMRGGQKEGESENKYVNPVPLQIVCESLTVRVCVCADCTLNKRVRVLSNVFFLLFYLYYFG